MIDITTHSESETMRLAEAMAKELRAGDVIALIGELGAGKTRFVRGLARGLGLNEKNVSSPTFVISHEYEPNAASETNKNAVTLVHIDAYRLHGPGDLESIGWEELLRRPNTILAVEWAGRIESALPADHVRVELEHAGEDARRIVIDEHGNVTGRFERLEHFGKTVAQQECPICARPVASGADTFPFCSQRCRMVDLGRWFSGSRMISRPIEESDLYED